MDQAHLKALTIRLTNIESDIKDVNDELKSLKDEKKQVEDELIAALEAAGGMGCSWDDLGLRIGLKTTIVPTIKDWDSALECLLSNDYTYLFPKRINSEGWRELQKQGIDIDGVTPFEKVSFSKTKYSK